MHNNIPREIYAEYFGNALTAVHSVPGGITNKTYLIQTNKNQQYILQQLHPIFTSSAIEDFRKVSQHLKSNNWEIQEIVTSKHGKYALYDTRSNLWRLTTHIAADNPNTIEIENQQLVAVGQLLATLHNVLKRLHYQPQFRIPHFHEANYYAKRLSEVVSHLPNSTIQTLAVNVLLAYSSLPKMPIAERQLIHGDPSTNNILYRNGMPFTYIDFDTLMIGTIWIDIGDLLRSLSGDISQTIPQFSYGRIQLIINGYYEKAAPKIPIETFFDHSLLAMRHITLELTMRFLIDIVDDAYFSWDGTQFASRSDNNLARAHAQWEIYHQSL